MGNFFTASLLLCMLHQSQLVNSFYSSIRVPAQVIKDKDNHAHAVVFFGSHACRACKYVYPQYLTLAEQCSNSTAFYAINVDGDREGLNYAQSLQIKALPTVAIYTQGNDTAMTMPCGPKHFRGFVRRIREL